MAAPKQGPESAPSAWIELDARYAEATLGLSAGDGTAVVDLKPVL